MKLYKKNKLIYGVGINDADYNIVRHEIVNGKKVQVWMCPYYRRWSSMLMRCYSDNCQSKNPTYRGCSVCDEWLTFSNFRKWMMTQMWEGNQLDKDLIIKNNKEYSSKSCSFVPKAINGLMTDCAASRGKYPIGVSKNGNGFSVYLAVNGKQTYLGIFNTPEEASEVYVKAKSDNILDVIEQHPTLDERVKQSLTAIAEEMSS